jgi:hypothetical protein
MTASTIEIPSAAPAVDNNLAVDPNVNIGETQEGGLSVSREGVTPPVVEPTGRPDKFKSDEDGWKAYRELEQKFAGKEPDASTEPPATTPPPVADPNTPDFSTYETELKDNGELSEKSYKELTDKGYPQELVDRYIEGQSALSDNLTNELVTLAGGAEPLKAMQEWAETNYSDAELKAFNASLDGDQATKKMALNGLKASYENAKGTDTNLLSGKPSNAAVDAYRSQAEVTAAMNDPRYTRDDAYRNDVMQKLKHSTFMIANTR